MNLLKINKNKEIEFLVDDDKNVSVSDLNKEDLYKILNHIYEQKDYYDMDDIDDIIALCPNPVMREISNIIKTEIENFMKQSDNIHKELDSEFTPMN